MSNCKTNAKALPIQWRYTAQYAANARSTLSASQHHDLRLRPCRAVRYNVGAPNHQQGVTRFAA